MQALFGKSAKKETDDDKKIRVSPSITSSSSGPFMSVTSQSCSDTLISKSPTNRRGFSEQKYEEVWRENKTISITNDTAYTLALTLHPYTEIKEFPDFKSSSQPSPGFQMICLSKGSSISFETNGQYHMLSVFWPNNGKDLLCQRRLMPSGSVLKLKQCHIDALVSYIKELKIDHENDSIDDKSGLSRDSSDCSSETTHNVFP